MPASYQKYPASYAKPNLIIPNSTFRIPKSKKSKISHSLRNRLVNHILDAGANVQA